MKHFFKRELKFFNFKAPLWGVIAIVSLILFTFSSLVVSYYLKSKTGVAEDSGRLITIYDSGSEKTILSQAETVEKALADANIEIDSSDTVEPALNTKLIASNYNINIYRSSPAIVIDDDREIRVVTSAQTGRTIVKDAGVELYDEDIVEIGPVADTWRSGGAVLQVKIKRATPINLTLYGNKKVIRTQAKTVGDFLKEKGLKIGEKDKFSPSEDTEITKDMEIKIWREGKNILTIDEDIPFEIEKILSNDHEVGYNEIKTPGEKGKRSVTYEIEIRDGREVGRKEVQSVILKEAKPQIEIVGIKAVLPSGSHEDWMSAAGISPSDYGYVNYIIAKESGWQHTISNPYSGAYGLCQALPGGKMVSAGADWQTNPITQLRWCNDYAVGRYGSWSNAYNFWLSNHWW